MNTLTSGLLLLSTVSAFQVGIPSFSMKRSGTRNLISSFYLMLLIHCFTALQAVATEKLYTFEKSAKIFAEAKVI
jgi:hypothetical protein